MKKIISVFISISILLSSVVFAADSVTSKSQHSAKALEVLKALEFVNDDYDSDDMDFSGKVTRADFAYLAGGIFNTTDSTYDELYFYDVPKDYYAFNEITYLAQQNAVSGKETKMFYPGDTITIQEAASIVIRGLGYGSILEFSGPWPSNVNTVMNKLNLCKNMGMSGDMTYNDMFIMLYNLLNVEVLEFKGNGYETNGETFLAAYYDTYHEKGVVKGFDEADYGSVTSNEGQAVINETRFEANGIDLSMLIGCEVEYMYRYDKHDDTYTLVWIEDTGKSDVLEISYLDDDAVFNKDTYEISYYVNNNRKKTVRLERGINLIYNGSMTASNVDSILSSAFDTIRLVDEDNNGKYDVGIVYTYENYVIGNHDMNNEIFYDANETKSFNYGEYERVDVYSVGNGKGTEADITVGSVVSVYPSQDKKRVIMHISVSTAEGYVSAIKDETDRTIFTIDGKEYTAVIDIQEKYKKTGQAVTLYLDYKGRIAYIKIGNEGMKYGYVKKIYLDETFDDDLLLKVFTEDGEWKKLQAAKKVKIDGVKYKDAAIAYDYLGGSELTPQLIRFELNSDGLVKNIDTVALNSDNSESMNCTGIKKTRVYKGGKLIVNDSEGSILVDSNTKIFCIPSDPVNAKDENYAVKARNSFTDWKSVVSESYSVGKDNFFEDAVIVYNTTWKDNLTLMVDKVLHVLNDDDDVIVEIEGVYEGKEIVVDCSVDCEVPDMKRGDIVYLSYNLNEEVSKIAVRYSPGGDFSPFKYDHANSYLFVMGYVHESSNNAVKIKKEGSANEYDDIYTVGTVWIYDTDDNSITKGTARDIVSEKQAGMGNIIAITTSQGYVKSCFVYK